MKALTAGLMFLATACERDPAFYLTRTQLRELDCKRMGHHEATERYPGQVPEVVAREMADVSRDVMVCAGRIMAENERKPRDEAILSTLSEQVSAITTQAAGAVAQGARWHVDTFYPSVEVAAKVSVAMKTELASRGLHVSDRVPLLAAGDLAVIGRLPPERSHAIACQRYFAEKSLEAPDVLLGIVLIDPAETSLHAGVCEAGAWRWLQ